MEEKLNILIVDDEKDICLMVSRMLERAGFLVGSSNSITEGRRKILTDEYQVFFLDLNLSDGTGFDLIPMIKQRNKEAKIIIISAYDGHLERERAKSYGVSSFIHKPFTKSQILDALS